MSPLSKVIHTSYLANYMIKLIIKAPFSDLALNFVVFLFLNDITKKEEVLFIAGKHTIVPCASENCVKVS